MSVEELLHRVARKGSWMGGGSVAALCAALSAALLEKLIVQPQAAKRLRKIQRTCLALIPRDARMFSRAIEATRHGDRHRFSRALKAATEVPWQVFAHAQTVQRMCEQAQRSVKPKFQSDLRCALAVALAASESARTLILTNVAWLNDAAYTRMMRHRLQSSTSRNSR